MLALAPTVPDSVSECAKSNVTKVARLAENARLQVADAMAMAFWRAEHGSRAALEANLIRLELFLDVPDLGPRP